MKNPSKHDDRSEPTFFSPQVSKARRFYINLQPDRSTKLAVVCGGLEHCASEYEIRRKNFPYYSIEYVISGGGNLQLRKSEHVLQSGRLFSYGPMVPHHIVGKKNDPLVKYFVDFTGTEASKLLRSCQMPLGSVAQVYPPNTLSSIFDEIIDVGLHGGRYGNRLCRMLLECLIQKIEMASAPFQGAETLAFATYRHCRAHIEKHFLRLRTLEQIALECHANNAYLCRLFHRYDQQTPYQYLLRLKMNYAAQRLQSAGALIKQVAEETGFADPFHFSRVFKNVLGLSPAVFRHIQ